MIDKAGNPMFDARIRTRLVQLADTLDVEAIAQLTGYDEEDIQYVLDHAGVSRQAQWWVRCNRSGRSYVARSKRGAYRLVCLKGLVDWEWGRGDGGALLVAARTAQSDLAQVGARDV